MFYACFSLIGSWEGEKYFRVGILLNKNLLGYYYRKRTTFSFRLNEWMALQYCILKLPVSNLIVQLPQVARV